jgi:hypothetical protein
MMRRGTSSCHYKTVQPVRHLVYLIVSHRQFFWGVGFSDFMLRRDIKGCEAIIGLFELPSNPDDDLVSYEAGSDCVMGSIYGMQ